MPWIWPRIARCLVSGRMGRWKEISRAVLGIGGVAAAPNAFTPWSLGCLLGCSWWPPPAPRYRWKSVAFPQSLPPASATRALPPQAPSSLPSTPSFPAHVDKGAAGRSWVCIQALLASPREAPGRAGKIQGRAGLRSSSWDVPDLCVA